VRVAGIKEQSPTGDPSSLTLAEKLDRCFQTMHPAGRGEWTYREVSRGIGDTGVTISPSYLWQLRKGQRDNPTVRQMQAVADFFHVPMTYFFGASEEVEIVDAQMMLVRAMRDHQVRDVALRASELSPAGLRAVANIIGELQNVSGMSARRGRRRPTGPDPDPDAGEGPAAGPAGTNPPGTEGLG